MPSATLCFLCFSFVGTVMLWHHSWYRLEDGCREQRSRKSHSPNDTMNPKGVTTKGMWIKVFVKALPNTVTSLINSCLAVSLPDNICISNVQYSQLSAQQNLWCEILEFWACSDNILTLCRLRYQEEKCAINTELNKPHRVAIAPLLHSNSATFIIQ